MDGCEQGNTWRACHVNQKARGNVEGIGLDVIDVPKPEPPTMRQECMISLAG